MSLALEYIRPGQCARITLDAYPSQTFTGTVDSIAPGSGSAFSLLPADNATGNFVRVVQRVPVKIRFTGNTSSAHLVPGLDLPAEGLEHGHEGGDDAARPPLGHRPADGVAGGGEDEPGRAGAEARRRGEALPVS